MSSREPPGSALFEGGDERVFLAVASDRDRDLLAERLGDRYEIVDGDPGGIDDVDLCIVDAATYPRAEDALDRLKRETAAYLPVLLLVADREGDGDVEWLAETVGGTVDDVLVIPTPPAELQDRVEAMVRARRQSRRSALYRRAMDEATLGISITDPDRPNNPIVYVNDRFCQITGYDREAALGRNCRFLQGPDTDPATTDRIRAAIDAEEPVSVEILNYRADGEPFWNLLAIAPVRDSRGEVTHYLGSQRDVTDRVERERELEHYEAIVETTSDPVYVLDRQGHFVRVNDAMVEQSGYDREELIGSHASMVGTDETVAETERYIEKLRNGPRERASFETSMVLKDGVRREFATSLAVLEDDDAFLGTVIVAHDITDLRRSQRRLSVLDRVLRHNLRNRLNVVLGYARELEDHPDEEVAELGGAITDSARNLLELSEEARAFAPVIAGEAQPTDMDAVDLVTAAVEEAREAFPDADISVETPDAAPIRGHETFRLAVGEIIENAIEHHHRESPTVEVDVRTADDRVEISVADDGPGIGALERRALAAGAETPLEHTQGLGLWLVNWTVGSVGGDLAIADAEPRGTVVTISVPRSND